MKGGDVNRFIDDAMIQEVAVMYNGRKYFFHGVIYNSDTKNYTFGIDIWNEQGYFVETVYDVATNTRDECMKRFFEASIFDGKKFWEAERDMEWVEW